MAQIRRHGDHFKMNLAIVIKQADIRLRAVVSLLLCTLYITGCNPNVDCEECHPPELAIEEMKTLRATITRHSRPFPESM